MKLYVVVCISFVFIALEHPAPARAQAAVVTVSYVAGWNMVGAPQGTDLSAAQYLETYGPNGTYVTASNTAMLCQGYFAYFLNPTPLTLTSSAVGPTQVCNLQVGWNLVGNPFAGAAQLPTGAEAYYLNTIRGSYDIVDVIPPGGSVWIDATPDTRQLTLTIVPTQSSAASTITIDAFAGAGPYRVHVGDSIKVEIASSSGYLAQVNSAYLVLETAGVTGPMSCVGQSCAITLVNRFWIYQAVAEGTAYIVFNPACRQIKPACGLPSFAIEIDIVP